MIRMFKKKDEKEEFPTEWSNGKVMGETLSLQSVENFFYYTVNPHLTETKIEKQVAAKMKDRGGINPNLIVLCMFVLIAGGVAFNMISNTTQSSDVTGKYIACKTELAAAGRQVVTVQDQQQAAAQPGYVPPMTNLPPIALTNTP